MNIEHKITLHARPEDVSAALIKANNIPVDYELKSFTYTLTKLKDVPHRDEYKITTCQLEFEKRKAPETNQAPTSPQGKEE